MNYIVIYLKGIIVPMLFIALAGIANANMDIVAHKFGKSIYKNKNENFYNPDKSWVNKWKLDEDGNPIVGKERFLGSSTLFVAWTDFWHLMQMVMIFCFICAIKGMNIITYKNCYKLNPLIRKFHSQRAEKLVFVLLDFVLLYLSFNVTFELFYRYILIT